METHLYGILYTILYVVLCNMFIETFEEKRKGIKNLYRYSAVICLIVSDYIISVTLDENIILKESVIIISGIFFMSICFQQKRIKIAILVLLYQGICFVIDYISIIVMSKCFPVITMKRLSEPLINFMLGTLSQMLLICFILLLRRYVVQKSSEVLTAAEWIHFSVFPLFTIIVLIAFLTNFGIPQNDRQKNILICTAFGLLIMNIMVFYLINNILKREMQIRDDRLILERVKNETGMYRTISENYEKQKKREHEYKNQLTFIAALARENKVDEINRYLKKYNHDMLADVSLIDSNNVIVNAILNSKYQEIKEKGIIFVIKVGDLSGLKIGDEDIVLILSNLLNNAIEANEKCDDAVIKLKFIRENHQIIISVENTFAAEPLVIGNKFVTNKTEDAEMHGMGIENIRETVEKYGGFCVIKHDEKHFRFVIFIPE